MSIQRMFSIFSLILSGIFLSGCASTPPPAKDPISVQPMDLSEREEVNVDRLFILTDVSRSMASGPIADARALTQSVVAGLPEENAFYEVSLISFGGDERSVRQMGRVERSELEAAAAEIQPLGGRGGGGGGTPVAAVLDEVAAEIQGKSGSTSIILISDGEADMSYKALRSAENLVANAGGPVCIHTIQVGDSERGSAFVNDLAGVTECGSARTASAIQTESDVDHLARTALAVQMGAALPAVAAAPPCETTVQLHGVRFGFDDATIQPDSIDILDQAAEELHGCMELNIVVGGHTDATGPEAYNVGLSERRAEAVRAQLVKAGVDEGRLSAEGYGPKDPVASNETREGRAQNRRVDLTPIR